MKVIVVSDLHGNVIGLAHRTIGDKLAVTARPRPGQHVDEIDLPAEHEGTKLHELHAVLRVERAGNRASFVKR